ncbi:TPA: phage tail sheath subtilisin-like domain-containing protein [Pasteurella multocida]|nr:phage tail sheath subtilisin-like domain-containing protein [Pasteurella multocida]
MAISFNDIPKANLIPLAFIEFDNSNAVSGVPEQIEKVLMLGTKLASGNATPNVAIRVTSSTQAKTLFGQGSQLAEMVNVFKRHNDLSDLWVLPLEEKSNGVAATGTVQVIGTATSTGVLSLMIAGYNFKVAVAIGDNAATLAGKMAKLIKPNLDLPFTVEASGDRLTVTSRTKGECGNDIDIRANYYDGELLPTGISLNITPMANGAINPDVGLAIANLGDAWWKYIINPFTDTESLNLLRPELERRWGPMAQIDGLCCMAKRGTHAQTSTFGTQRNDHLFTTLGTNLAPQPAYIWATAFGAVCSKYLAIDPARPLQTLPLDLLPPKTSDRWEYNERNVLLFDGISTYTVDTGGRPQLETVVTMYRKNRYGDTDPSYRFVETIATLSRWRYAIKARISQKYPRHKLAKDGTRVSPGQAIVTPQTIRTELFSLFTELEWQGLVEDFEQFKRDLLVEIDENNPCRVNVLSNPNLVNQFRMYAERTAFKL